jgi:hypothetical protein
MHLVGYMYSEGTLISASALSHCRFVLGLLQDYKLSCYPSQYPPSISIIILAT